MPMGMVRHTHLQILRVGLSIRGFGAGGESFTPSASFWKRRIVRMVMGQGPHRINLTAEHYYLVRRFMVDRRLASARVAAQKMIELAAKVAEAEEDTGEHAKNQREHRSDLLRSHV